MFNQIEEGIILVKNKQVIYHNGQCIQLMDLVAKKMRKTIDTSQWLKTKFLKVVAIAASKPNKSVKTESDISLSYLDLFIC